MVVCALLWVRMGDSVFADVTVYMRTQQLAAAFFLLCACVCLSSSQATAAWPSHTTYTHTCHLHLCAWHSRVRPTSAVSHALKAGGEPQLRVGCKSRPPLGVLGLDERLRNIRKGGHPAFWS